MNISTTKAIVTGHTRGLGEAIAETLLTRGIGVLAIARTKNAALAKRHRSKLEEVELDLSDLARVESWLAGDALQRFVAGAQTALLINNAGMLQPVGTLEQQDAGAIARAVSLNVATPLMLASAFAVASADAQDRRIVHVSSGAARNAYPGWSIYCATKAALDHHARAVALDGNRALSIASVAPGVVDTDMQGEIRSTGLERFPLREKFDALKREGLLATPVQAAKKLVDYALSETFGSAPVMDVRELL
ncbi:short chain dehydrogenase [Caballeronia terrestris]|uniref:Short chain dehydrogenase n=1 Tax=Caballeronia terrestris TaxID=1226301 RepID=A0A158K0S1_9BURK|nr:SDR family oxidoreductase [Caballeronia terrestris]SAL74555.1 short chain dehydrogenase [Caballeronia terrestris]